MTKKYKTPSSSTPMAEEPSVTYDVCPSLRTRVEPVSHLQSASPNAHTPEEMHAILTERIRRAEAGEEKLVPNQVVFDSIRTKYGF